MSAAIAVGLMVPVNNTTMEREMLAWLPAGSSCTTLRIPRGKGLLTTDTLPAYREQALSLAAQFRQRYIDIVAYGCTAAGFISGPAGDASLAADLAAITARPVVTTARSMVLSLQACNARAIALVTPYLDHVNEQLKAFLADGGIHVQRFDSFYAANVDELGRIESNAVARLARATMDDACDALFIACAQLPTRDILDDLQREFGRPVLSSIWATAQQVRRTFDRLRGSVESRRAKAH
jgi:maleate isomerase